MGGSDAADVGASLQAELRRTLRAAGDAERATAQQRYMKSTLPLAGVPMAEVRRLARQLGHRHLFPDRPAFESGIRRLWDSAELREERYAAIEVTGLREYRRWQDEQLLALYRHLIVTGAWWDLVDDVAVHRVGPLRRSEPASVDPYLRRWAHDPDLWLRRTALVAQVGSKDALDTDLLADVLRPNLARREFFLRKAVGWALRDASAVRPEWVRAYVDAHRDELSPLSLREATRRLPPTALDPEVTHE